MNAAESGIRANEAALAAANIQMEYTLIRAPFDAVVLTKNADIGDIVTPLAAVAEAKSAVVTIADMDSLQVEADVAESNVGQVRAGQPCEIQLDALPERRLRGEVHVVVPTGDRTKATVMVKVKFIDQDPRILPEMSAKVSFLSKPLADVEQKPRTGSRQHRPGDPEGGQGRIPGPRGPGGGDAGPDRRADGRDGGSGGRR